MLSCLDFYKDVGYVCGDVRFSVKYAGNWPFLAVAVNDSFHVYRLMGMSLLNLTSLRPIVRTEGGHGNLLTIQVTIYPVRETVAHGNGMGNILAPHMHTLLDDRGLCRVEDAVLSRQLETL